MAYEQLTIWYIDELLQLYTIGNTVGISYKIYPGDWVTRLILGAKMLQFLAPLIFFFSYARDSIILVGGGSSLSGRQML